MLKLLLAVALATAPLAAAQSSDPVDVYRVKTCSCCSKWMDHLRAGGFRVTEHVVETRDAAPPRARVPEQLRSCHTAEVGGYIVEGHVPADIVQAMLTKRPAIVGIAVPGMPAGSPGMESDQPVAYDVIAFDDKGNTFVFARVDPHQKK